MTWTISLVANVFNFCVLKFTVAVQLSRKTGGTPHSEIFWQFLHHCLDAFPECFVSLEPQNTNDGILAIGTSSSQGNKICKSGKGKQKFKDFFVKFLLDFFNKPQFTNCSLHQCKLSAKLTICFHTTVRKKRDHKFTRGWCYHEFFCQWQTLGQLCHYTQVSLH